MIKNKGKLKHSIFILAAAGAITLAAASGVFRNADLALQDRLYQRPRPVDDTITIIGIDTKALEDIGPYQDWGRDIIAQTVDILNESEEVRPAVIGIDVLYIGSSSNPDADEYLAEAAGRYGNVVTACAAEFGSGIAENEDGSFSMDEFVIQGFEEPYPELLSVTENAHINAMLDSDGILRHALWEIKPEDGRSIPSFASAIANKYREYTGEQPVGRPYTDRRGFWYVPFSGRPGDYSIPLSVADILSGEVTAEELQGKIVLIGPYAAGLQDSYPTAIDHAEQMYGVEYQANAVRALLDEDHKREAGAAYQLSFLFVFSLILTELMTGRRVRTSLLICASSVVLYCAAALYLYSCGLVVWALYAPAAAVLIFVSGIASNYVRSVLEKLHITDTFKRYVAPEIVNEVLKDEEAVREPGGKMVDIAVLFVDIRGFTTMSESLSPEEVVSILNRYLTLVSDCILEYGGTLDKFIGDAAMAFWNAPLPQEDYVMSALRAAEAMRQGSKDLSQELLEKYGRTVSFGIGVHAGKAVVGNIGSPKRMDYTAIGDTVNTSSRLESNAPAGTIYISREVADRVEGRIRCTSLGSSIKLKGKSEGFEILTLDEIL